MKDQWCETIDNYVDSIADELRKIRRYLHAHPELSGEEFETSQYIARHLQTAGINHAMPLSRRGIIADGGRQNEGSRIAMRGDIDALPLHDEKDVGYRSTFAGMAHACGHDAHATMLLGAAMALQHCQHRLPWPVTWRAIFQPAEETTQGALEMIDAGAMEGVSAIVALHVDPERGVGRVGLRQGALTAACEELQITIHGEGGHAARPHHTRDPIATASQLVNAVYQFIPRSIDSREPVVVSFGMIQGGASANVIPDQVRLRGTIRTTSSTTTNRVKERILAIGHGLAEASQTRIDLHFKAGADAVINDAWVVELCGEAACQLVGRDQIDTISLPSMGSEDFAAYLTHAPGCMLRLGIAGDTNSSYFLHSPRFDIDERALTIGSKLLAYIVVRLAKPTQRR